MRYGFKDVTSEYTGGGIWIYMGQPTETTSCVPMMQSML